MEQTSIPRYLLRTFLLGSLLGVLIFAVYLLANTARAW